MIAIRSKNKTDDETDELSQCEGEAGQTLVEYGTILTFMAVALVASLLFLEQGVDLTYDGIIADIQSLVP